MAQIKKPFIIAEGGGNHKNEISIAKEMIIKAAQAGADAIKFQTYKADKLATKKAPRFYLVDGKVRQDELTQYESYLQREKLPLDRYPELIKTCEENNIEFLSTPFDEDALDYLVSIGMKRIKIASTDITNFPMLIRAADKKLPIILSTGGSTMDEINEAVELIKSRGNNQLTLLHCTVCYPTDHKDVNLLAMEDLKKSFPYPIGVSDHSPGIIAPIVAAVLGAEIIEKHYTLDRTLATNVGNRMSVTPEELKEMVDGIKVALESLGDKNKKPAEIEKIFIENYRRSIITKRPIMAGEIITADAVICKRPGTGISPKFLGQVIGRTVKRNILEDEVIKWDDFIQTN